MIVDAGQVDGETFDGDAVGEKCQKVAGYTGEMNRQGRTHQQVAQVDHEDRENDRQVPSMATAMNREPPAKTSRMYYL